MLSELRIVDLGVIGEATIEPDPGFTVVTGETGAGKTMVVTGLSLLAGAKADQRLVRSGSSRALVEGRLRLREAELAKLVELGAEIEDGEVLVARQLSSRSRITIGGAQITAATAAELAQEWVTIHGQLEQVHLGLESRQREILDTFADNKIKLAKYQEAYAERRVAKVEKERLEGEAQARARELGLLHFGLEEIEKITPEPDEDIALEAEAARLQSVDDLRQAGQLAIVALAGGEDSFDESVDAISLLAKARKALAIAAQSDTSLAPTVSQLADADAVLADVVASVSSYLSTLEADPIRLEWIAGRRAELQGLTRKYGDTIAEVLAWAQNAAKRVLELDSSDERITLLATRIELLDAKLAEQASAITKARVSAAEELAKLTAAELKALAMPQSRLIFEVTSLEELGPYGGDRIRLLFAANVGGEPGPLSKIASGGELSRVRLALEVVLAATQGGQTFIFDEVDSGVGGQVALEIGQRLARLAAHSQVIVVTHLAQVAAFADRHYVVTKAADGQVTTSTVAEVKEAQRLETLAKMMSGLDSNEASLAHAAELLAQAHSNK